MAYGMQVLEQRQRHHKYPHQRRLARRSFL
jgi:hypothetical protein